MPRILMPCLVVLGLAGCATPVPPALHTGWVVEVVATAPSDAPGGGAEHDGKFEAFPGELSSHCAIPLGGPEAVPLALVRYSYYWHNGGAPARQNLAWYPVAPGIDVEPGRVVVAEALAGHAGPGSRCPWITEVLAADLDEAQCRYVSPSAPAATFALSLAAMIGPPGSASLDCPALEAAGWEKRPFGLYGGTVLTRTP